MRHGLFKKSLSVSVREETYDRIKSISEIENVSMGDVVRGILESNLKKIQAKEVNHV